MANLPVVVYKAANDRLEIPQAGDAYEMAKDLDVTGNFTLSGSIKGISDGDWTSGWNKLSNISVTGAVNLDTINARITALDSATVLMGSWDASTLLFPASTNAGETWICTVAGTVDGVEFNVGDRVIALIDSAPNNVYAGNWLIADYTDKVSSVAGKVGVVTLVEADITDLQSYLLATDLDSLAKINAIVGETLLADSSLDTFAELQALVADETILAASSIDTLAELNAIVGDATLDDSGDARPPTAHTHSLDEITDAETLNDGLTAYATGGQTNATLLTAGKTNIVDTVATAGDSVKLPSAAEGVRVRVENRGAEYLDLFPNTSDNIGQLAIDLAIRLYPNCRVELLAYDNAQWEIQ